MPSRSQVPLLVKAPACRRAIHRRLSISVFSLCDYQSLIPTMGDCSTPACHVRGLSRREDAQDERGKVVDEEGRRLTAYLPSSMVEEGLVPPHPRFATFCNFKTSSGFAVFFGNTVSSTALQHSARRPCACSTAFFILLKLVCFSPSNWPWLQGGTLLANSGLGAGLEN